MSERAYHHGDLKRAFVATGIQLLRSEGTSGLAAREAAREVGVSVTALYRHFASVEEWRADVSTAAREALAQTMLDAMADVKKSRDPKHAARRRFRACGEGYVSFALTEPNLFTGAFMPCTAAPSRPDDPSAWSILESSLDDLEEAGALDPRLRRAAPLIAWTSVHGLSALIVQGSVPVGSVKDDAVRAVLEGIDRALALGGEL